MRALTLSLTLVLAACPGDPLAGTTCDATTPVLGANTELPITWAAAADGSTPSAPFALVVPSDVVGLSLTLDAGDSKVAFQALTIAGRVLVDATQGTPFGQAPGTGRSRARIDTAWDTSGDTASDGGPGGALSWYAPPLFHGPGVASTVGLPMSPDTRPWGGCLTGQAVWLGEGSPGTTRLRGIARTTPTSARTLDVNMVRLKGADITEAQIEAAIDRMVEVYAGADALELGEVVHHVLDVPTPYVRSSATALGPLRAATIPGASDRALTFLFLADFAGEAGTLGIAAGIPGAAVSGTHGSAVAISVEAHLDGNGRLLTSLMGETMAHEAGHQFGLFHTTEAEGTSFDILDDTPNCAAATYDDGDGELTAEECASADGRNLMFWTAGDFAQDQLSSQQADVLVRHVLARESR